VIETYARTSKILQRKDSQVRPTLQELLTKIHELRSHLENIKAFTVLLWRTKAISEGFFIQVSASAEEISKQIVGWEKYLIRHMMPQTQKDKEFP
jgi:hypothetical protein